MPNRIYSSSPKRIVITKVIQTYSRNKRLFQSFRCTVARIESEISFLSRYWIKNDLSWYVFLAPARAKNLFCYYGLCFETSKLKDSTKLWCYKCFDDRFSFFLHIYGVILAMHWVFDMAVYGWLLQSELHKGNFISKKKIHYIYNMLKYLLANGYWSINGGKWTGTKLLQQSVPPYQFVCYFPPLLADK